MKINPKRKAVTASALITGIEKAEHKVSRQRNLALNLINVSSVKKLAMNLSRETRAGKYTCVSRATLETINRAVAEHVAKILRDARGGKTL